MLHVCFFDESVQQAQLPIHRDSHRYIGDHTHVPKAQMHTDTNREQERETEPDALHAVRYANRRTDGEAITCERLAEMGFHQRRSANALFYTET